MGIGVFRKIAGFALVVGLAGARTVLAGSFCHLQVVELGKGVQPARTAYRRAGSPDRPLLVLLHGFKAESNDFRRVERLLGQEYDVVAIDQIGHGATPADGTDYSSARLAEHVRATLVALRLGERPMILLGHSLGARTATVYAATYPGHVRALILEDMDLLPSHAPPMTAEERDQLVAIPHVFPSVLDATVEFMPYLGPDAFLWVQELGTPTPDGQVFVPFSVGAWFLRGHQANREDLGPTLAKVRAPVALFQADPELNARLQAAGVDHALGHRPSTHVRRFDGAYHGIHQSQPESFVDAIREFVRTAP